MTKSHKNFASWTKKMKFATTYLGNQDNISARCDNDSVEQKVVGLRSS